MKRLMPILRGKCVLLGVITMFSLGGCGEPALHRALKGTDPKVVEKLIDEGGSLNTRGSEGKTPLHVALEFKQRAAFEQLLKKGADPNLCDQYGASVVHCAAQEDDLYWLKMVLQHGGNPDQPNTGNPHFPNRTPIYYAINKENTDAVVLLIEAGANLDHRDANGMTAFSEAMSRYMFVAARKMIEAGANPIKIGKDGDNYMYLYFNKDGELPENGKCGMLGVRDEKKREEYRALTELMDKKGYFKNGYFK